MEKQIQDKITKIVKRATCSKEMEDKVAEMSREIQITEEMNTKLEAEVSSGSNQTRSKIYSARSGEDSED